MASSDGSVADSQLTGPSRRSRSGCWTCRSKAVKKRCDQRRPTCGRCARLDLGCDYSTRPTLAERRRAQKTSSVTHIDAADETTILSPIPSSRSTSPSLSLVRLATPASAACSLELSNADHEAIRHFRTELRKSHHVKNTDYSLISLMFKIARDEPMVMNMVIAIGLQETNLRRPVPEATGRQSSLVHYSSALRQLADSIAPNSETNNLDALYTTLWMMLLYEQQHGDPQCVAYTQHLKGISSLLRHQSDNISSPTTCYTLPSESPVGLPDGTYFPEVRNISVYSARILVWISLLDAAAASAGIGGQVNTTILDTLFSSASWSSKPSTDTLQAIFHFHQYSGPLYRMAWGDAYPQDEMADDVENRGAYSLLAACVQLRFLTAQLAILQRKDTLAAAQKAIDVESSINHVGATYSELVNVASSLSAGPNKNGRLMSNICAVVPLYYAVELDFMRLTTFDEPLSERQRHALQEIMNLTFQGHKYGGDEAMIKVAWVLFVAALETDDLIHRAWILDRFAAISKVGKNFERAYHFLLIAIPLQRKLGKRIDARELMETLPKFVLG